jgi:hypothetical protein
VSDPINSTEVHPGAQISEHIRLFSRVGSDHWGSVWNAVHAFEGRVAVKVFDGRVPDDIGAPVLEEGSLADGNMFVVCGPDHADALIAEAPPPEVPETTYDTMINALTCTPPLKRNWFPVIAAAALVAIGVFLGFRVF